MLKFTFYLFILMLAGYTDKSNDDLNEGLVDYKIVFASDTVCNTETRYQYILTNEFYRLIYLKDENLTRDTIVDEQPNFMNDSIQYLILNKSDFISENQPLGNCLPVCNITINGELSSFLIDPGHPQEIVCEILKILNEMAADKYRLELCYE